MTPPDRHSPSTRDAFDQESASDPGPRKGGRDLPHRVLLVALAALLFAISAWCLLLLFRSVALRQELDLHQGWIDDMRHARAALERPVADLARQGSWPVLENLRLESEQLLGEHEDPAFRQAAQRLGSSLEQLHAALQGQQTPDDPTPDDGAAPGAPNPGDPALAEKVWDASFAVLKAASALEEQIQAQVDRIYDRLDRHWRALNILVVVCLLLCASNLGLLQLAHRRRQQLEQARDRALELASHDPLTGLWNREAILRMLRREMARSKRLEVTMGLILVDVDGFRQINGLIGQERGDVVLQEISWRLGSLVRPYDTMGRFAGDAFLIVLPTCGRGATAAVAQRLGEALDEQEVEYGVGRIAVSVSMAHATIERPDETDPDLLIHRLQEALIAARATTPEGAIVGLDHTRALATAVETLPAQ